MAAIFDGSRVLRVFEQTVAERLVGCRRILDYARNEPRDGIGHQIATWGENFQMKQLLAGVVMIAAIAIAFNEMVRWVETRCSHWRT